MIHATSEKRDDELHVNSNKIDIFNQDTATSSMRENEKAKSSLRTILGNVDFTQNKVGPWNKDPPLRTWQLLI